jgi:oxygen-independent coproporphyrinogen-3 oxidase
MWGLDLNRLNTIAKGAADQLQVEARKFFDKEWITQKEHTIYLTTTGKLYADNIAAGLFF